MPKAVEGENDDALHANLAINTLFSVVGKVVVISGGGSGIGAMIASAFVQNGAKVYIFSRKDTARFAAQLNAKGPGSCTALVADLSSSDSLRAMVEQLTAKEGKVDVLVNNAGTNYNGTLEDTPRSSFSKVLDVNVTAVFETIQLFYPLLLAAS